MSDETDFEEALKNIDVFCRVLAKKLAEADRADIKVANSLLQLKETIEIECNKFLQVAPVVPHLRSIVSTLQKIADKGATIAEIAINRSLETHGKGVDEILRVVKHVRQLPVAKFTKG